MIILKLGGSIITKKNSSDSEIDEMNLKRISREIKKFIDDSDKQLVIVHGAGSFGHPPAKQYGMMKNILKKELDFQRHKMLLKSSTCLFVKHLLVKIFLQ